MNIFIRPQFGLSLDPWSEHDLKTVDAERAGELVDLAASTQALVSIFGQSRTGKTSAVEQALTTTQALVVEAQRPERERVHLGDVMVALVRDLTEERESARRSGEARAGQGAACWAIPAARWSSSSTTLTSSTRRRYAASNACAS